MPETNLQSGFILLLISFYIVTNVKGSDKALHNVDESIVSYQQVK